MEEERHCDAEWLGAEWNAGRERMNGKGAYLIASQAGVWQSKGIGLNIQADWSQKASRIRSQWSTEEGRWLLLFYITSLSQYQNLGPSNKAKCERIQERHSLNYGANIDPICTTLLKQDHTTLNRYGFPCRILGSVFILFHPKISRRFTRSVVFF